VLLFQVS